MMPTIENKCIEALNNLQRLCGKKRYKDMLLYIDKKKLTKLNDDENISKPEKILKIIVDKYLVILFNNLHGFSKHGELNTFIEIINHKYYENKYEKLIRYLENKKDEYFSTEMIDQINMLLFKTISMGERFSSLKIELVNLEKKYLNFLKKFRDRIKDFFDEKRLDNKELAFFNIEEMIKLHEGLLNHPKFKDKLYKPYKDNIQLFKNVYIPYLTNKERIEDYYIENIKNLDDEMFATKKLISKLFMKPVTHVLGYSSYFEDLQTNCFMAEESSFSFLAGGFNDLVGMANEAKRRKDGTAFLNEIKSSIDGYDKIEKANFGDLLFYNETDMIFRTNKRRYLTLLFDRGFVVLYRNEDDRYSFLEGFSYSKMVKCEIYNEETKNVLKIIWKSNNAREMIIIPFKKYENVEKIKSHIDEQIKKLHKNELRQNDNYKSFGRGIMNEKVNSKNKDDYIAMKIEFGTIHFLDTISNECTIEDIKKQIIARIAEKLDANTKVKESKISLNYFNDISFYIRDGQRLFPLTNNRELEAANKLFNSKLDVLVCKTKDNEK